MDKQTGYIHTMELLLNDKKKWITDTQKMNGSQMYFTMSKKLVLKRHISYNYKG